MTRAILSLLIVFSSELQAQLSLTQSFNEPKPGDLESTFALDTSAYASGLPISLTGSNVVWDYTHLTAVQPVLDSYYLSASNVTNSANYPGCTFVQESNNLYTYFKSTTTPTTQTELLGIQTSTISMNFSNSGIIAKYPISYGFSLTDNLSGTFTFSIGGTCSGSVVTTADGLGTLKLPEGFTFSNVLRVKGVQTITLTAFFTQVGILKQTIYNYYHASQKFPLLSVSYTQFNSSLIPSPINSGFAAGSINCFVTGLKENRLSDLDVRLYPNPAKDKIIVESTISDPVVIRLYDQLGKLVLKSEGEESIDISLLESGIYIAEILSGNSIGRKKIIKD